MNSELAAGATLTFEGMAATPLPELLRIVAGAPSDPPPDLEELSGLDALELSTRLRCDAVGAERLAAAFELGRRRGLQRRPARPVLDSPAAVFAYAAPAARDLRVEVFRTLVLDTRHRLVCDEVVSRGVLTASLVHPREVFRPALVRSGACVVVVHNHPSGDPAPSQADDQVTERLCRAGQLLGVAVTDHLVMGDGCFFSYREQGKIPVHGPEHADLSAAEHAS